MKKLWSYLFLLFLITSSCDNNFDNGTKHPIKQTHDYHDEEQGHTRGDATTDSSNNDLSEEDRFSNIGGTAPNLYGSADRRFWQKPDLIIRRLGNLEGKVLADVGAGPYGYFTFRIVSKTNVDKVLAIDVDQQPLSYIDSLKTLMLPIDLQRKVQTRLVGTNGPKLKEGEVDIVFMVNIYLYFDKGIEYLKQVRKGLKKGGKIFLVDFKKKRLPIGPTADEKVALYQIENDLEAAGFINIISDDRSLEYQYIVEATNL